MRSVVIEVQFSPDDVCRAKTLFDEQAQAVRELAGCKHYALYTAGTGIAIVQRWVSKEAFDAYRGTEMFSELGQNLKPMMIGPPVTTIAEIDAV